MDVNYSVSINPYPSKGDLSVLFSGYSQTTSDHKVGPRVEGHHLLHYVMSGKGTYYCLGKEYSISAGMAFFISPGELARYDADAAEPWEYCWIGFKGTYADELLSKLNISSHNPVTQPISNSRTAAYFRKIQRVLHIGEPTCDLQANGWFRLILAELVKGQGMNPEQEPQPETEINKQVEQAVRWLTLQYQQPISIEQMAQSLGYHRTYLSKMFKKHTGMSPMHFLLQMRMEKSKLLLQDQILTVEQVAASVGFQDALYFSRQFKKKFGQSPTEYRRQGAGESAFHCSR